MSDRLFLDLGSGRQWAKAPDHIHIDIRDGEHIEYVWDLERGLPKATWQKVGDTAFESTDHYKVFADNTVDEIRASHCLEHVHKLNELMDEMWDALKPNGILKVYVPNAECPRAAWGDPGHCRAFSVLTMGYYTTESQAAFPITERPWKILDGYPKVNGTAPHDLYEIEWWMTPDK